MREARRVKARGAGNEKGGSHGGCGNRQCPRAEQLENEHAGRKRAVGAAGKERGHNGHSEHAPRNLRRTESRRPIGQGDSQTSPYGENRHDLTAFETAGQR